MMYDFKFFFVGVYQSCTEVCANKDIPVQSLFKNDKLVWKRAKYVGPNSVFFLSYAPRTLLTAGVTDVQKNIIKGLWAS